MNSPRLCPTRLTVRAACLLALASPAVAGTLVYPGAICQSEGEVTRPISGGLFNADQGASGTHTMFHCPVMRTRSLGSPAAYTVQIRLNVQRNLNPVSWNCQMRAVDLGGGIHATAVALVPAWYGNGSPISSVFFSLNVPNAQATRSYALRCNVPTGAGIDLAGIVSIEITD